MKAAFAQELDKRIMTTSAEQTNLLNFDLAQLKSFFAELGEKPFRATQLFKWVYQQGVTDFEQMSNFSKSMRASLKEHCFIEAPEIAVEQVSADGTVKWMMRLQDGNRIETVFIPEAKRGTLCVSSQVGCSLNCRFCSTATQGYSRDLTTAEIIGQVWRAAQRLKEKKFSDLHDTITNVVMMGMGEPLMNQDALAKALSIMREDNAFGLARRRVTVSSSGVVPGIQRLGEESEVALAISLHAPNDELRNQLVPINKKYPIKELMQVCREYTKHYSKCKITMEYVMLKDVNDQLHHAKQLTRILATVPCKINLIPFNPFPGADYECSSEKTIDAFKYHLINAGFVTVVRKTRGQDIDAACGQLVGQVKDRTKRSLRHKLKQEKSVEQFVTIQKPTVTTGALLTH